MTKGTIPHTHTAHSALHRTKHTTCRQRTKRIEVHTLARPRQQSETVASVNTSTSNHVKRNLPPLALHDCYGQLQRGKDVFAMVRNNEQQSRGAHAGGASTTVRRNSCLRQDTNEQPRKEKSSAACILRLAYRLSEEKMCLPRCATTNKNRGAYANPASTTVRRNSCVRQDTNEQPRQEKSSTACILRLASKLVRMLHPVLWFAVRYP